MNLKVKRLRPDAILPTRGTEHSAGLDLYLLPTPKCWFVEPGTPFTLPLGIALEIPIGMVGLIRARSSATLKGLVITGTIDTDYRGGIGLLISTLDERGLYLYGGNSYAQLIIVPYLDCSVDEVDELSSTVRGTNGFGSTGNT